MPFKVSVLSMRSFLALKAELDSSLEFDQLNFTIDSNCIALANASCSDAGFTCSSCILNRELSRASMNWSRSSTSRRSEGGGHRGRHGGSCHRGRVLALELCSLRV